MKNTFIIESYDVVQLTNMAHDIIIINLMSKDNINLLCKKVLTQ